MNDTIVKKTRVVKRKIDTNENVNNVGRVTNVLDYVIEISNLNEVSLYESISINKNTKGFIIEIKYNKAVALITEKNTDIKIGDEVVANKCEYKCLYSLDSIGRIVDIYGHNLMNDHMLNELVNIGINYNEIPLLDRVLPASKLTTGIAGIDLLNPIVKGQKEAIIGPSGIGKTLLAENIVTNETNKDVICFYVALNKSKKEIKKLYENFTREEAVRYTGIFATFDNEVVNTFLTPLVVANISRELTLQGYSVLIVIDDINEYKSTIEEIESTLNKLSCNFNTNLKYYLSNILELSFVHKDGGSTTILPIVDDSDTDLVNIVTSMCEGKIVLSEDLYKRGILPSIDYLSSSSNLKNFIDDDNLELKTKVLENLQKYESIKNKYAGISVKGYAPHMLELSSNGEKIYRALSQEKFTNKSIEEIQKELNFLNKEA